MSTWQKNWVRVWTLCGVLHACAFAVLFWAIWTLWPYDTVPDTVQIPFNVTFGVTWGLLTIFTVASLIWVLVSSTGYNYAEMRSYHINSPWENHKENA